MAERILKGVGEALTHKDAKDMADKAEVQLLYQIKVLIDEATDDEEERANASVNMARYVGAYKNACLLEGLLADPDAYLDELKLPEGAVAEIEEVRIGR